MRFLLLLLALSFTPIAVMAEEVGGEHAEGQSGEHGAKKPPPAPPKGTPMETIYKLPVVTAWTKWVAAYKGQLLNIWGESLREVEGHKCWGVAVGQTFSSPKIPTRVWKRFCAPVEGGDVWVETMPNGPDGDIVYMTYDKWVEKCAPTENSEGSC